MSPRCAAALSLPDKRSNLGAIEQGESAMPTTVIRDADWVIAWDAAVAHHSYRRGVDVAFTDAEIVFVGPGFTGTADRIIDGQHRMVMPGLIDIHSHPHHEPLYRGIREEHGLPSMSMTGLRRSSCMDI
jgi:cytosine/adenosine deaminase-related metal-dependent hydrolase